ncbi:MAG: hypothetical protein L7F77_03665 [Candidatus Magnetominusculus sp. LBB02]|nr:hypothetical protein [Candidatus Magnetominusculus sp. LBB02]
MRKTKLVTISLMPELMAQAEVMATEEHRTISELVRAASRSYLLNRKLQQISRYGQMNARELDIGGDPDVARLIEEYRTEPQNSY